MPGAGGEAITNKLNLNALKISVILAHDTCPICLCECLYGAREGQTYVVGAFGAMRPHWTTPVARAGAFLDQETRWRWLGSMEASKVIIR